MPWERRAVQKGMVVLDSSGRRLGTVRACGPSEFAIGWPRRSSKRAAYDDIVSLDNGVVHLSKNPEARDAPLGMWSSIHPLADR